MGDGTEALERKLPARLMGWGAKVLGAVAAASIISGAGMLFQIQMNLARIQVQLAQVQIDLSRAAADRWTGKDHAAYAEMINKQISYLDIRLNNLEAR